LFSLRFHYKTYQIHIIKKKKKKKEKKRGILDGVGKDDAGREVLTLRKDHSTSGRLQGLLQEQAHLDAPVLEERVQGLLQLHELPEREVFVSLA
jgi:hypothetical protein